MNRDRLFTFATLTIPALVLVGLVVPPLLLAPQLPDPIATHWSLDGEPNGKMPVWALMLLQAVIWIALAGYPLLDRLRSRGLDVPGEADRSVLPPLALPLAAGALLLGVETSILATNLGVENWTDAKLNLALHFPLMAMVVGAAWFGGHALEQRFDEAPAATSDQPSVSLSEDETALWIGSAHNVGLGLLLIATLLFGLSLGRASEPAVWFILVTAVLVGMAFTAVRLLISRRGLDIQLGPLRWPRKQIRLSEIAAASVMQVQPMRHGGWGYRRCGPGCRGFVIRKGEGLRLELTSGRTLVVTVDDAETAAGLVNDLVGASKS